MPPSSTVHGGQHDTKHVTFELLLRAAFVAHEIWGICLNQLVLVRGRVILSPVPDVSLFFGPESGRTGSSLFLGNIVAVVVVVVNVEVDVVVTRSIIRAKRVSN